MIPTQPEHFDSQWLNETLSTLLHGVSVTSSKAYMSDVPGQTAEVVLIEVEYDGQTDLPEKMVAKITSHNPAVVQDLIPNYDQYRRETAFYREFPDVGIAVPRCLYEAHIPETNEFVLLMEDLAPSTCPSWGITPDQVGIALAALPGFHAGWWNDPQLRQKDWMVQPDEASFYSAAFKAASHGAEVAEQHFENVETSLAVLQYAAENGDSLLAWLASRPFTFVHGDYHAKQMFFPGEAGGEFSVIDWQFPFVAPGAWDFARLEGMCMSTEDRHQHEARLMQQYVAALVHAGVSDYTTLDFEADYRFGLFMSQVIMGVAQGDTDIAIMEKECSALGVDWRDATFLRTQRAMEEWNVLDFLKQL